MEEYFWSAVETLVENSEIIIDRPKSSSHPSHPRVVYPLDYGYLKGTQSGDHAGIDVWIGSHIEQDVTAIVCTIDLDKSDAEVKILIGCTDRDIAEIMTFHNQGAQSAILLQRNNPTPTE
jgi:inorganic pyrophosphatase